MTVEMHSMYRFGHSMGLGWAPPGERLDFIALEIDGNGVSALGDSNQGDDPVMSYVTEVIKAKWEPGLEKMTYKEYVQTVKVPGDKRNEDIKGQQKALIGNFLQFLQESEHPQYQKAKKLYEDTVTKYVNPQTGKIEFKILPSVIALTERIKKACHHCITLRTIGKDREKIETAYNKVGIQFPRKAQMHPTEGMRFEIGPDVFSEAITGEKLLEARKEGEYILGQDNFKVWNENGERAGWSKMIPCSADAQFKGLKIVSIFADDNFRKGNVENPNEKNIGFPKDVYDRPTSWESRGVIGIHVNPLKAALNEQYLIRKVNKELQKRCFRPI